jgi:hypothetical protein
MKVSFPYQTDIYVKCLQVSVTYLLQYCSITATRSTISAKYLHKSCRYLQICELSVKISAKYLHKNCRYFADVDYLSIYLQNICIQVADICRYVNCLSTYLQNICIKVADICRYVNCLSKYLQNICIKIADICRYANCLSIYSISTTQQKNSYWENNSYFKKIFVETNFLN